MISVLIPVYNTDVRQLVSELSLQLSKADIPYEVIVIDDFSIDHYRNLNAVIEDIEACIYVEAIMNKGRLQTRLDLASKAQYEWLLFLDADCAIISTTFIDDYLSAAETNDGVIIGGRTYQPIPPDDKDVMLHWKYGSVRERKKFPVVKKDQYLNFMTNNFLIKKELFQSLTFEKRLNRYGHEDTWMGIQFELQKSSITHINNPVLHLGLEKNVVFLEKSIEALQNIKVLLESVDEIIVRRHIKIYRILYLLRASKMEKLFRSTFDVFEKFISKNLNSSDPALFFFDLYRLRRLQEIIS